MSLTVYGGHDRMERIYIDEAKKLNIKAKVYTYGRNNVKKTIGSSDGIVIFTDTISHKLASVISKEARKKQIPVMVCHNSSKNSFTSTIKQFVL